MWGTAWFDYDNDGWLDVLAVNGAFRQVSSQAGDPFPYGERNLLLRNTGDGGLRDVTDQAGAVFDLVEVSRGAVFGDVDNDGDVDVLVSNVPRGSSSTTSARTRTGSASGSSVRKLRGTWWALG